VNTSNVLRTAPIVCALVLAPAIASAQRVPDDIAAPLPADVRRIAEDVPNEHTPTPDIRYILSNEHRHDLFFPHVSELGGAFVGVGTDQCYTLAAMQNARLVWAVDYDPQVPLIHRMYNVLIRASDTPDALVAKFSPAERAQTETLLRTQLGSDPDAERIVSVYHRNRERLFGYLQRSQRRIDGVPLSWLADPELYRRVRALNNAGRIIARTGDVTAGDGAMAAIARAATRLHIPLRVIYFSNAEQFFRYLPPMVAVLDALPTDQRTVVLRTFREQGAPYPSPGERWHYMVQPMTDLRARIHENGYRYSRMIVLDIMQDRTHLGRNGISVVDSRVPRRFSLTPRGAAQNRD
jgi:hypothetical protein